MYKVIEKFIDRDGKEYNVGDKYKPKNKTVLKRLSTDSNKYKRPFIVEVKEHEWSHSRFYWSV